MHLFLKFLRMMGFILHMYKYLYLQKKIPSSPSLSLPILFIYPDIVKWAKLIVRCMPTPPVVFEANDKLPTDIVLCSGFKLERLDAPTAVPNNVAAAEDKG